MVRIGLLAAVVFSVSGCGGDPCADTSCPNDTKQTASEYQSCVNRHNADKNKACATESVNLELCSQASRVCNSAGKTDGSATYTKYSNNCAAAQEAVTCCAINATGFLTCK